MKKWYLWLGLSLIFAIGGIVNYFDGKSITGSVIQVCITTILAFVQLICDNNGKIGKKIFKYIEITVTVCIVVWLLFLIFDMLFK